MGARLEEHAAIVALLRTLPRGAGWSSVVDGMRESGSALGLLEARQRDALVRDSVLDEAFSRALVEVRAWADAGLRMIGFLDEDYPVRLAEVHEAPPFLFVNGNPAVVNRAVAVVGSRRASAKGLRMAASVAKALATERITVLSGLALGIDAAAHRAAIEAGGATAAVIGTGITRVYPPQHSDLQSQVARHGVVLSQFWPDAPPQKQNFLMRNAVMSGIGYATVVIEAGEHSGARSQARMAVEHGRPVILTDHVATNNEWAQALKGRPGVHVVSGVDDLMEVVGDMLTQRERIDHLLREIAGTAL